MRLRSFAPPEKRLLSGRHLQRWWHDR